MTTKDPTWLLSMRMVAVNEDGGKAMVEGQDAGSLSPQQQDDV